MKKTAIVILIAVVSLGLSGCNPLGLPKAKSEARQKAALIAGKKVELQENIKELDALIEEHEQATPEEQAEKKSEVDRKKIEITDLAKETAAEIRALKELTASIADTEIVIKETVEQAEGLAAILPSPWREAVILAIGIGSTVLTGRRRAEGKVADARMEGYDAAEAIGIAAVRSVDKILTPEQKKQITQGDETKALVNKAQGKV